MKASHAGRNAAASTIAVILLMTVAAAPVLSEQSDGAGVAGTYDVYLQKGQTWTTSISYTASLSPSVTVKVSSTESGASSDDGWSGSTTDATKAISGTDSAPTVYSTACVTSGSHCATVSIKVGSGFTGTTSYTGVKISTSNPPQSAVTVFRVHVLDMSFATGYEGGSFHAGLKLTDQVPAISLGNTEVSAKTVAYSISTGSNGATLSKNTGLTFDSSDGRISGTVTCTTNSQVTYTVTSTVTFASGYPASQTVSTSFSLGTYATASAADASAYAITNVSEVSVGKPTTAGITYTVDSLSCSVDKGDSVTLTTGTAYNGLTVSAEGAVTGVPTRAGVYVFEENLKVTETGQTSSRTVTVTVEDQVTVSLDAQIVNRYTGNATVGSLITTAAHTEGRQVNGTWTISSVNDDGCFTVGSDGKVSVSETPEPGTYVLGVRYTSTAGSSNYGTAVLKVYVDPALNLTCSDDDSVLYAATSSTYLDRGQDCATMSQTSTLYAGSRTVSYDLSCSDGTSVLSFVSVNSAGVVSVADTVDASCIGSHVVTVTCTDDAVTDNTATAALTIVVVAGMTVSAPTVGEISSH